MFASRWNDEDFLERGYTFVCPYSQITTETSRHPQKMGSNPQTKADIILQGAKPLDPSTLLCFVLPDICLVALIAAHVSKVITRGADNKLY